jgi:hypothetical protein
MACNVNKAINFFFLFRFVLIVKDKIFNLRILIECYIDDEKKEKATELTKTAEKFIRQSVPNMYNDFFAFAVE